VFLHAFSFSEAGVRAGVKAGINGKHGK